MSDQGVAGKPIEATAEEERAIRSLERLARRWPSSLWLFSASGVLNVMRKGPDGGHAFLGGEGSGIDPGYSLATISIDNDGGDW